MLVLLAGSLLVSGCVQAPKSMYGWGSYQGQVYEYLKGQDSGTERQIAALEADLEKMRAKGEVPAPGLHAHLGLLYANLGKDEATVRELQTEKSLFPESAQYVDFLLSKNKK
jgi:hypothetical protein